MADLLIKGMEIPKRCTGCFHSKCLLFFEHTDPNNSRHPNCPLIKLPPHGRLIDADALRMKYEYGENRKILDKAPTVLEANYE